MTQRELTENRKFVEAVARTPIADDIAVYEDLATHTGMAVRRRLIPVALPVRSTICVVSSKSRKT